MAERKETEPSLLYELWDNDRTNGGKWHLVKEFSRWKLSNPEIKKLEARTE
jgi:hypothetical protein